MNTNSIDTRRILIFIAFAFGIAWAVALIIALTGQLVDSPVLFSMPGLGELSLALVLLAVVYMPAPALAHVLTRLLTGEGWQGAKLRPRLRGGWPYWLIAWFGPALLTIIGMGVYFALFPANFDPTLSAVQTQLDRAADLAGEAIPFAPWMVVAINSTVGVLLAPFINGLFTFGEEFGWRAYLQPKLMPLGGRTTMLLMGLIWGVWHAPIIVMGHNYGLEYPGAPWAGPLMMIWFTLLTGTFLGWVTLRGGSVWPAVIGHAAINGFASFAIIFMQGDFNPLLGPLPVGVIGSAGFALAAAVIMLVPGALAPEGTPTTEEVENE